MAKNKDPFDTNYNVDDDWSLGGEFEDFDSDFNDVKTPKKPKSKARQAIDAVGTYGTDALDGVSFAAETALKTAISKAMPNAYRAYEDATGSANTEFSKAKEEILKSFSPVAQQTKQLWRSLSPQLSKILPEKIAKKLNEVTAEENEEEKKKSEQERRTQYINDAVANALKIQTKQSAVEAEERRFNTVLDRKLEEKRHGSTIDVLSKIYRESEYITEFYKSTMTGYFSQSLKLKFESLFISKDILATLQVMSKSFDQKLESIVKNSSLPDIQKQRLSESYKAVSRGKIMQKFSDKFYKTVGDIGKNVGKNLTEKIKGGIRGIGDAVSMADQMVSMNEMMSGMDDMMEDGAAQPNMMTSMAVNQGSSFLAEFLAKRILSKMSKEKRDKFSNFVTSATTKPEEMIGNWKEKLFLKLSDMSQNKKQEWESDSFLGSMGIKAQNFALDLIGADNIHKNIVENKLAKDPFSPTQFDIASRTAIVTVIPEYLSGILQQVTELNTGQDTEKMVYDERTLKFTTLNKYKENILQLAFKDKEDRSGDHFASAKAAVTGGAQNRAESDLELARYKKRIKDFDKDIEIVLKNHATTGQELHPEYIKVWVEGLPEGQESNFYLSSAAERYCRSVFKGIDENENDNTKSKQVAQLLTIAFFQPDGKKNTIAVSTFNKAILALMRDDQHLDITQKVIDQGKSHLIGDLFKEKKNKENYDGSLEFDDNYAIDKFIRDFNPEEHADRQHKAYKQLKEKIDRSGLVLEDVIDELPGPLRRFAQRHLSEETRKKKRWSDNVYSKDQKAIDEGWFGSQSPDINNVIEETNKKKGKSKKKSKSAASFTRNVTNNTTIEGPLDVNVISTTGTHVLQSHLENIYKSLSNLHISTEQTSKDDKFDTLTAILNDIKLTLATQLANLEVWRQEFKSAAVTQMSLQHISASGVPAPKGLLDRLKRAIAEFSLIKATGSIVGGFFKGAGMASSAYAKGIFGVTKAVAPPTIKAVGTTLGGLFKGAGPAIGGIAAGGGTAIKGLFDLYKSVGSTVFGGAKSAVTGTALRLWSSAKYLFGKENIDEKKTQITNKINEYIDKGKKYVDDVFVPGMEKALITKQDFIDGLYEKMEDGKTRVIESVEDLKNAKGEIFNKATNEKIADARQFVEGLYDKHGKKIVTNITNIKNKIQEEYKAGGLRGVGRSAFKKLGSSAASAAGWLGKSAIGMPGTPMNALMGMGFDAIKWGGRTVGSLAERFLGIDSSGKGGGRGISERTLKRLVSKKLDIIISLLKSDGKDTTVFGDTDGDGDREGSYEDYVQKRKEEKEADKEKGLLGKLAAMMNKDKGGKDKDEDKGGGLLSSLLWWLPGGKTLIRKLKSFTGGIGRMLMGALKRIGGKGLLGLLSVLFGGGLFSTIKTGIMGLLGLGGGGAAAAAGAAATAGTAATGAAALGGSAAAAKMGKSMLNAAEASATVGQTVSATTKMASGAAAAGSAAAKNEGIIVRCLNWLKSKLPKAWHRHIDKLITSFGKITSRLSASSLGKIVARIGSGPLGWAVLVGSMLYQAGKAFLFPQELLGISNDIPVSWGDKFIIGVSSAVCDGIFLGLIPTMFIAKLLGVDTSKYEKAYESQMDEKINKLEKLATTEDKINKMKGRAGLTGQNVANRQLEEAYNEQSNYYQNKNQQNASGPSIVDRATNFFSKILNSGEYGKNQPTSSDTLAGVGSSGDSATTGFGDHYKPGDYQKHSADRTGVNLSQFENIKPVTPSGGGDKLGSYVAKYESGKGGSKTIAWDSTGGTSYGKYQLAAKTGVFKDFINMIKKSNNPNKDIVLKMMSPIKNWDVGGNWKGTDAAKVWIMMAEKGLIQDFEHEFQKRRYDQVLNNCPSDLRQAIEGNRGLQEMLWSTVVQHGPGGTKEMNGATGIFLKCWKSGMPLDQFVKAVYAKRGTQFGRSTPKIRASVQNRFKNECALILGLLGKEGIKPGESTENTAAAAGNLDTAAASSSASSGSTSDPTQSTSTTSTGAGSTPSSGGGGSGDSASAGSSGSASSGDNDISYMVDPKQLAGPSTNNGSSVDQYGNSADWQDHYTPGLLNKDKIQARTISNKEAQEGFDKLKKNKNSIKLDYPPAMKHALGALNADFMKTIGRPMLVTSGTRTLAEQKHLYETLPKGKAARPNPNAPHIKGYAIDINTPDLNKAEKLGLLQKHNLYRPFWPKGLGRTPAESWHLELKGYRDGKVDLNKEPEGEVQDGKAPTGEELEKKVEDKNKSDAGAGASEGGAAASTGDAAQTAASVGGGGSPDPTQSTSTGSTNGTEMSTIPSGGGAGSATAENITTDSSSGSSTASGGTTAIDFSPLISILQQANVYLETIAKNTGGMSSGSSESSSSTSSSSSSNDTTTSSSDSASTSTSSKSSGDTVKSTNDTQSASTENKPSTASLFDKYKKKDTTFQRRTVRPTLSDLFDDDDDDDDNDIDMDMINSHDPNYRRRLREQNSRFNVLDTSRQGATEKHFT